MATCGPTNAATQMSKFVNTDNSLHHERAGTGVQPNAMGLRGDPRQLSQSDRQRLESMQQGRPDPFQFDHFRQNVPGFAGQAPHAAAPGTAWAQEFRQSPTPQPLAPATSAPAAPSSGWAQEFNGSTAGPTAGPTGVPAAAGYSQPMLRGSGYMHGMGSAMGPMMGPTVGAPRMSAVPADAQVQNTTAWDAEFEKLEKGMSASAIESATDNATDNTTATQNASTSETVAETTSKTAAETLAESTERIMTEQEEEELNRNFSYFDTNHSYPPNWDEMWNNISNQDDSAANLRTESFEAHPGSYKFESDNPFRGEDDPFEMGVFYMDNGAKLSTAVLCFEEAVRRNPQHVEAWARLGMAQAQNEVEDQAIVALERAISLNPLHDRALLNLAISYTNEGYDAAASQLLEKWIFSKYANIVGSVPAARDQSTESLHARVTDMFLSVATQAPTLDADVQVGLGVLCYRNDDYDKAIDCFRAALSMNENDPSLWNRLGATLANASRPEEAIEAYERALSLRPSFVRARYNLSVSCINIGCYREACEHLLSALALHETDEHKGVDLNSSASLVDTLRRVFFAMDRRDLLVHLQQGTSLDIFRKEFNF